jgi:uncharacterized protein YbjT (DUF2867 family)
MKIVVIGGSGLIGKNVANRLREAGHEVLPASPSSGVDSVTGEGLSGALAGASVVIDVSNSPSFEPAAVLSFFEKSTTNLLAAASRAGVSHYVALSIVGMERLPSNGYFRAKLAQERLIAGSQVPYTIVRATQFFEFVRAITQLASTDQGVRVPPARIQPVAAEDVAAFVAEAALLSPRNNTLEFGGPESFRFDALIRESLAANGDHREVLVDPAARYFDSLLEENTLVAGPSARLGSLRFADWLKQPAK